MDKGRLLMLGCLLVITLAGCGKSNSPTAREQPEFPQLKEYWVVDNGCDFDPESVRIADETFEQLRRDGITEIAVICQTRVKNLGPANDEKIWLMNWGRAVKLGDKENNRAIAILIRPDVAPEQNRITIEFSRWQYWYTPIDYWDDIEEAASYANAGDFSGALDSIARNTNEALRKLWESHQTSGQ